MDPSNKDIKVLLDTVITRIEKNEKENKRISDALIVVKEELKDPLRVPTSLPVVLKNTWVLSGYKFNPVTVNVSPSVIFLYISIHVNRSASQGVLA